MQNTIYDLSVLAWTLTGYLPYQWDLLHSIELGQNLHCDIQTISASVPGSVQKNLLGAGLIENWNYGDNYRLCEWVENRNWLFEADIPDDWVANSSHYFLKIYGLDYKGRIYINSKKVYEFDNGFTNHEVELTQFFNKSGNSIKILFECPPRWLGQFGYTSQIKDYKPRFNYSWDWTRRLVQIGIYGHIFIEKFESVNVKDVSLYTDYDTKLGTGKIFIRSEIVSKSKIYAEIILIDEMGEVFSDKREINGSVLSFDSLKVLPWWPNGQGNQKLYTLTVKIFDDKFDLVKEVSKTVGFKNVKWKNCKNKPHSCSPWICCINDNDVFLQGVNWTPIRPNFADLKEEDYCLRLQHYKDMGFNLIRVWGGGFKEHKWLYDICDNLGLLVWQEFPLSSSGIDNCPPLDDDAVDKMKVIAESYIKTLQHHISIVNWCGGNELQTALDGSAGIGLPSDCSHPMLGSLEKIVKVLDPLRRFLPTSPSGPRFNANREDFNKNLHWNVHGPWKAQGFSRAKWLDYWINEDSHFRAEVGVPGPSSAAIIRKYKGHFQELPISLKNPLWASSSWWIEDTEFLEENGRCPLSLEEYVDWGQERQSLLLCTALETYKNKFPHCGGFIIWMGHDSYPCPANTSLIDFEGNLKPVCSQLKKINQKFRKGNKYV